MLVASIAMLQSMDQSEASVTGSPSSIPTFAQTAIENARTWVVARARLPLIGAGRSSGLARSFPAISFEQALHPQAQAAGAQRRSRPAHTTQSVNNYHATLAAPLPTRAAEPPGD